MTQPQPDKETIGWIKRIGVALLQSVLALMPFLAVFYFFIPLQNYTHWAFVTYWRIIWFVPLVGLMQLGLTTVSWSRRWRVIGISSGLSVVVVTILTLAWNAQG